MNYVLTFLEGLASFISPCVLPMLPVYAIYFAGGDSAKGRSVARVGAFVIGFSVLFVILGIFAGSIGAALAAHRLMVARVCGVIVIIFGLSYLGLIRLPSAGVNVGRVRVEGVLSSFVFGLVFAVGLMPCVGAFLGAALMQAASRQTALHGATLLATYSLGLGLPLFVSALCIERMKSLFAFIKSRYRVINPICGGMLVLIGVVMVITASGMRFFTLTQDRTDEVAVEEATDDGPDPEVMLSDDNFETEVMESDIPVIVSFWAAWCDPCRKLAPELEAFARANRGKYKICKANVDEVVEHAGRYGITSIPTLILFRNGKIVDMAVGYMSRADIAERFK